MKQFLAIIFILYLNSAMAQVTIPAFTDRAFQRYDILISGAVSLSYPHEDVKPYAHRNGTQLPLSAYLDLGVHNYISIGIFGGINKRFYKFAPPMETEVQYTADHYSFGLRGSFHFLPLLEKGMDLDLNSNRLDLYISPAIGYRYTEFLNIDFERETKVVGGVTAGARYYVWGGLALMGEFGYGVFGYGNFGLTFRI